MTTICYDHKNKVIAVDGRINMDGVILDDGANKSISNGLGKWFFTGKVCDNLALSKAKHDDKLEVIPDCCALVRVINDVYLVTVRNEGFCEWTKCEYNVAIGSGDRFALSALDFGKSAKEAIEYEATKDVYTGGKIREYFIDVEKG